MILRRLNVDFLGVYVSVNMDAETLLAAINLAVTNRPELQQVLAIYITVLQGLQQINIEINTKRNLSILYYYLNLYLKLYLSKGSNIEILVRY